MCSSFGSHVLAVLHNGNTTLGLDLQLWLHLPTVLGMQTDMLQHTLAPCWHSEWYLSLSTTVPSVQCISGVCHAQPMAMHAYAMVHQHHIVPHHRHRLDCMQPSLLVEFPEI